MIDLTVIPLFARLSAGEYATLAGMLKERAVAAHETIFWIGDPGTEFFIVEQGEIVLSYPDEAGHERTLGASSSARSRSCRESLAPRR